MAMKLKKNLKLYLGIVVTLVFCIYFFNRSVDEDAIRLAKGNWVASESLCNDKVSGIIGLDLDETSMLENGAKYDVDHYQVELINREFTCGIVGTAHFTYKVTMHPSMVSLEVGVMDDLAVARNNKGQVYFKLTPEFRALYEEIKAKS